MRLVKPQPEPTEEELRREKVESWGDQVRYPEGERERNRIAEAVFRTIRQDRLSNAIHHAR